MYEKWQNLAIIQEASWILILFSIFIKSSLLWLFVNIFVTRCVSLDGVVSEALKQDNVQSIRLIRHLLQTLEKQYLTAKQDMLLAARSSPLHGNVIIIIL